MKKTSILLMAILCLFTGCSKNNNKSENLISIVTTSFPCYDAARAILGDKLDNKNITLKLLVKPGTEIHSYDPTPQDIIHTQKSDLFIYIGGDSDEWVNRVLNSSKNELKGTSLRLMDYVETLDEVSFEDSEDNDEDDEEGPEQDEHIWTSPLNELKIIEVIRDSLCSIAETKKINYKDDFIKNAALYSEEINKIEKLTKSILLSKSNKTLIMADRFPFTYYANYYGIKYDAAFHGCSTAVEASAQTIGRLIDSVKKENLPAVFYIELGNHKIADTISKECKVKSILLQSVQNLTKDDFEKGETWVSLMNRNAIALQEGLK